MHHRKHREKDGPIKGVCYGLSTINNQPLAPPHGVPHPLGPTGLGTRDAYTFYPVRIQPTLTSSQRSSLPLGVNFIMVYLAF